MWPNIECDDEPCLCLPDPEAEGAWNDRCDPQPGVHSAPVCHRSSECRSRDRFSKRDDCVSSTPMSECLNWQGSHSQEVEGVRPVELAAGTRNERSRLLV